MFERMKAKYLIRVLCIALFLVTTFWVGFVYYSNKNRVDQREVAEKASLPRRNHAIRHEFKGFQYTGSYEGRKIISIQADKFNIQKKKYGFFRFALVNEARLENAVIHLYGSRTEHTSEKTDTIKKISNELVMTGDVSENLSQGITNNASKNNVPYKKISDKANIKDNNNKHLTFKGALSPKNFSAIPGKRISGFKLEPVELVLHDGNMVVTKIIAGYASVRLKKKQINFKSEVKMVSGSRVLKTDRLNLNPETNVVTVDGNYIYNKSGKVLQGTGLITDIYLSFAI